MIQDKKNSIGIWKVDRPQSISETEPTITALQHVLKILLTIRAENGAATNTNPLRPIVSRLKEQLEIYRE
jgi:hypothetical protein